MQNFDNIEHGDVCCWQHLGNKMATRMILCPECGNKRCPKATDCSLDCTNSNEPGQAGSVYGTPVDSITQAEDDGYDGSEYSPEELAALDEYFQRYGKMASLYEELIQLEEDPTRRQQLQLLLASLHEDNK